MENVSHRGEFEELLPSKFIGGAVSLTGLAVCAVLLIAGLFQHPLLLISVGSLYGIGGAFSSINRRVQSYLRINNGAFPAMYVNPNSESAHSPDEEFERTLPDAWVFSVSFALAALSYAVVFFYGNNFFFFASGIALGYSLTNFFIWYRIRLFKKKYHITV